MALRRRRFGLVLADLPAAEPGLRPPSRRRKSMKRTMGLILAVVLASSFAVTAQARTGSSAHPRGQKSADVTFTKWMTSLPNDPSAAGASMAGVVGGDVGDGTYAGIVLSDDTTSVPGFWLGHALYGIIGSEHTFVANNFITEDDTVSPVTATIAGRVVVGWMRDARVTGEYTAFDTCPIPTPGNVLGTVCFQGTLHLQLG